MPHFFGISPGEEKTGPGIRVKVTDDGEQVWMHGKWLDLAEDHAVAWIENGAEFHTKSGKDLHIGDFPAWVVRSSVKGGPIAIMFSFGQFDGGKITIKPSAKRRR